VNIRIKIFAVEKIGLLRRAVGGRCGGRWRRWRLGISRRRRHFHRAAILIHQNVVGHLDGPAIDVISVRQ